MHISYSLGNFCVYKLNEEWERKKGKKWRKYFVLKEICMKRLENKIVNWYFLFINF